MKKVSLLFSAFLMIGMLFCTQVSAQGRIELNGAKSARVCSDITLTGFSASFSYNSIESQLVNTEKGVFSKITMGNSVAAGNFGEPQVPVTRELIAVPFGATPVVDVKSYTVEEYNLSDYGIERLYPQQPSQRKDIENPKFEYNPAAYAAKGFDENRPIAEVNVMGTMRGIQIGALQLNSLRYNAATNTVRVYNNIELEVRFENADLARTEKTLVNTYSPYFRPVYGMLFNNKAIQDIYDDHPDLWAVPVKILVVADRMFEEAMQPWLTWKTEKGFYLDVNYTDEIGTSASQIKSFIHGKYNEGVALGQAPTFLIIFGDKNQVPGSQTGSSSHCVTDLYYYTTDNDVFGDMFHSRFTCETVEELNNVLYKSLQYEQYTMPDPSYLSNTLLIAGWDSYWTAYDGAPSIQYAMEYYYNADHGFENVYNWLGQPYTGCYQPMNTGVAFVNYTAHGSNTSWADPSFTNSNIDQLTNTDKYFWAMGNCCQAADWGISGKCFGEKFIIVPNKGAFAYVGSCPSTYWYEDYYFTVGATNVFGRMPLFDETTTGIYDTQFQDDFNSLSSVPFVGNVAVAYSHANGYQGSVTDEYYWESYHVLGDGSICYYHVNPIENEVQHLPTLPIGMDFYTVTAAPGSYVGISQNGVLYGAGEIGESGTADIPITPITSGGDVKIVVTHPQRQPYIAIVPAAAMEGAYIAVDAYTPNNAHVGDESSMTITFKNVGAAATEGTTTVELSCEDTNFNIINGTSSFETLEPDNSVDVEGFTYQILQGVADGTKFNVFYTATCGETVWEGKVIITAGEATLTFQNMGYPGGFIPGETLTVTATFANTGHYMATNAIAEIASTSPYLTFENPTFEIGTLDPNGTAVCVFHVAVDATCPTTEVLPIDFTVHADGSLVSEGSGMLKNSCNVIFNLMDSYGDGWNGASLNVSFDDGTPSQSLTIPSGGASANYVMEIGNGVTVSLTWNSGSWDSEVSFEVRYENGDVIFTQGANPSAGLLYSFVCNCAGTSATGTLDPVQDVAYAVEGNQIIVTWEPAEGAVNYIVYRNGIEIGQTTETTYTDEILNAQDQTYCIVAEYPVGVATPECTIVTDPTAVGELESTISVYPNPVNNTLFIEGGHTEYSYTLYNGMGQMVLTGNAQGTERINVSGMSKGIYFLQITSGSQNIIQKVVVE